MVVAFDFGGSSIKLGIIDSGDIIAQTVIGDIDSRLIKPLLPRMHETINSLCQSIHQDDRDITKIGMAIPSVVDSKKGRVLSEYVKYQDFNDADLHGWVKKNWGCDLKLENDARATTRRFTHAGHGDHAQAGYDHKE